MAEYETAAYQSLERLKAEHDQQVIDLLENFQSKASNKFTCSRKLIDMRRVEALMFKTKKYVQANRNRSMAD